MPKIRKAETTTAIVPHDPDEVHEAVVSILHLISRGVGTDLLTMFDHVSSDFYTYPEHPNVRLRVHFPNRQKALTACQKDITSALNILGQSRRQADETGCQIDIEKAKNRLETTADLVLRKIIEASAQPGYADMLLPIGDLIRVNKEILSISGRSPVEEKNVRIVGSTTVQHQGSVNVSNLPGEAYTSSHFGSTHDLGAIDAQFEEVSADS